MAVLPNPEDEPPGSAYAFLLALTPPAHTYRLIDTATGEILLEHLTAVAARAWQDTYERDGLEVIRRPDRRTP